MEPVKEQGLGPRQQVYLGTYEVLERTPSTITIHLGKQVTITIHTTADYQIKPGDTLPLYTEIPIALPGHPNGQPSS